MPVIENPNGPGLIEVKDLPAPVQQEESVKPTGSSKMVGTDGKLYDVPAASYDIAIKQGWRLPSAAESDKEQKIEEGVNYGENNRLETGVKRYGNEALFGVPDLASDYSAAPEQREIQQTIRSRLEKRHPIESALEKGAGFITDLAIPGVGEAGELASTAVRGGAAVAERAAESALIDAAAKTAVETTAKESLSRGLAANAAKYATESALYSAPAAATQAMYGDKEAAAETMLWGTGAGAALGVGGELLSLGAKTAGHAGESLIDSAGNYLGKGDDGISKIDNIARKKILGISDASANKLGAARVENLINKADEEGILSANPKNHAKMIDNMLNRSGDEIGKHEKALDSILENTPDAKGPQPLEIAQEFQQQVVERHPEILQDLHKSSLNFFDKVHDAIAELPDDANFTDLRDLKRSIDKSVKNFHADSVESNIVRNADAIINKHSESLAQQLYQQGNLPEELPKYLNSKKSYQAALDLSKNINPFKGTGNIPNIGLKDVMALTAYHPGVGAAVAIADHAIKAFSQNKFGLLGKSVSYLRKNINDPNIGGYIAKEAVSALQSHINNIPAYLSGSKVVSLATTSAVQHFIGNTAGLSKEQQFKKISDTINASAINIENTGHAVGQLSSIYTGHSPILASLYANKQLSALSYLQSQIPKNTSPPKPFQKNDWTASKQQQQDFMKKLEVATNPNIIWKHYQEGTLNGIDRDVVKTIYPKIYQQFVDKIVQTAYNPKSKPLSHTQRMQLSIFSGVPLDSSLKNISSIQSAIQPVAQSNTQQPHKRASRAPKFEHSPSLLTESQKRTYGV